MRRYQKAQIRSFWVHHFSMSALFLLWLIGFLSFRFQNGALDGREIAVAEIGRGSGPDFHRPRAVRIGGSFFQTFQRQCHFRVSGSKLRNFTERIFKEFQKILPSFFI